MQLGLAGARSIFPIVAPFHLATYAYSSLSSFKSTEKSLRNKKIGNDSLMTTMSLLALGTGHYIALGILSVSFAVGDKIIAKTRRSSEAILKDSFSGFPNKVWIIKNNIEEEINLENIKKDDIIIVNIGDTIVVDGSVIDGSGMVDQHTLTGEAQPAEKVVGDTVLASTLLVSGKIYIKAEKTGQETTVANIDTLLQNSIDFKSKMHLKGDLWADSSAKPFLVAAGLSSVIFNPALGLVVLSASYGNGIRVLAPLVTYTHTKIASDKGILVKDGRIFEKLQEIDTFLFDRV